jgi:hypothetical protein
MTNKTIIAIIIKNMNFEILPDTFDILPKPNNPAITEITKKIKAHLSIKITPLFDDLLTS